MRVQTVKGTKIDILEKQQRKNTNNSLTLVTRGKGFVAMRCTGTHCHPLNETGEEASLYDFYYPALVGDTNAYPQCICLCVHIE